MYNCDGLRFNNVESFFLFVPNDNFVNLKLRDFIFFVDNSSLLSLVALDSDYVNFIEMKMFRCLR